MQDIHFARWHIASDPLATQAAYSTFVSYDSTAVDWHGGRNWIQARDRGLTFPDAALRLFTQLGIDPQKAVELYRIARLESGLQSYGGWFHFVGAIISGRDTMLPGGSSPFQPDFEPIDANFELGFTARVDLLQRSFEGYPVVQLDFSANVPWLLGEPEPQ